MDQQWHPKLLLLVWTNAGKGLTCLHADYNNSWCYSGVVCGINSSAVSDTSIREHKQPVGMQGGAEDFH